MLRQFKNGSCAVIAVIILALILGGITSFYIYLGSLPPISQLQNYQPNLVSQIVSSDGEVIRTFGSYKYKKVGLEKIPKNLREAIIAIEDKNFYKHSGFDPVALVRSTLNNLMARKMVQGASTITQQLARILFLSSEKTLDRKIKELVIANRLEKTLSKDEILGMYLNNVYLGEGAYGVSAASEVYFNKPVENLTLPEAALIAGLPQAPSIYSPYQNMKLAKARRAQVLDRMVKEGFISKEEADKANEAPINICKGHRPYASNKAPYFVDYIMKELNDKGFTEQEISQGGYKIYTTLNYGYQKAAQQSVDRNMANWGLRKAYQQASLVSYDNVSGKILAYIGGKDYIESQYDRVSQAIRQPGSSFKMFVYTTAMERGLNPNSIYSDSPLTIGKWSPHNYGSKYRGKLPLFKALAFSSNVIAVRLTMDVGVDEVRNTARRLGITTPIAGDPTIALGSSGVKLLELTNAYGVIANGGIKVQPYGIERIEASNGKVVYQANSNYTRVLDTRVASYMVEMLKQVVKIGTGKAANIGRPVAGKTGTTDSYKDAWFVGFSPEVVTGVWVGSDNNKSNPGLTGGTVPARIWADYMRVVEKTRPVLDFLYPEIVIENGNTAYTESNEDNQAVTENTNTQNPGTGQTDQDYVDPEQDESAPPAPQNPSPTPTFTQKPDQSVPPIPDNG